MTSHQDMLTVSDRFGITAHCSCGNTGHGPTMQSARRALRLACSPDAVEDYTWPVPAWTGDSD